MSGQRRRSGGVAFLEGPLCCAGGLRRPWDTHDGPAHLLSMTPGCRREIRTDLRTDRVVMPTRALGGVVLAFDYRFGKYVRAPQNGNRHAQREHEQCDPEGTVSPD